MKSTEKATQRAILQYLALRKIFHWRNNSGAFKNPKGHLYFFGTTGSPDIFAIIKGQIYGIEVKDIKGKQNDNQIEFQKGFEKAGGVYILARSLDEVLKELV